jgi:hypothetical protein
LSDDNKRRTLLLTVLLLSGVVLFGLARVQRTPAQAGTGETVRIPLKPEMVRSESELADFSGLVDEQDAIGDPPEAEAKTAWRINARHNKSFPFAAVIDLGQERKLSSAWVYDINDSGDIALSGGTPGDWKPIARFTTNRYRAWTEVPLNTTTRYLRVELKSPGAIVAELALYAYTDAGYDAFLKRQAEAKRAEEAAARERAERDAALERARQEAAIRPVVTMAPFGRLSLVDEVDLGAADPGHQFDEYPKGVSRVETILGRKARVLTKTDGEAAFMSVRLGRLKVLKPGGQYVLAMDYPEDGPRSWLVMNGGSETSRGFHTGRTLGDAFHPKYVNNLNESLDVPLSGRWETWKLYFSLHDRFPERAFIRGAGVRALASEEGFTVAIGQFSANNIPVSQGAAVSRIRLYEVLEPERLKAAYILPPAGLPRRHLFWREEMADGVIQSQKEEERGVRDRLDWYRYKARLMHFLGMNTFSKDLLEFGAVQHWDTSPHGGNRWAYFDGGTADLWGRIVEHMGKEGFTVLPYYEYSGSKGQQGLGSQRRAKPLTRDDAYSHIQWIESANADITYPDTYADFKKMLDLTVVREAKKAEFAGIWLRPRGQMPIGFGDATRARFAKEANEGQAVTRDQLKADQALLERYYAWWYGKQRQFLSAMRDYLAQNGVREPQVLFTAEPGEPGTSFNSWEPRVVTDDPRFWEPIVSRPEHVAGDRKIRPVSIQEVVSKDLYLEGLLAPALNWGGWELHHRSPAAAPRLYKETPGVLMTHPFNRAYTVASPKTMETFRGPSGLAMIRHYSLNENMMFDKEDRSLLGYFVADIERAGPYCMLAEARAMAHGDPTHLGYLAGNNFGRGFPEYVRSFNTAFLSLPALPSEIVPGASPDPDVVVRAIRTEKHGTWYSVVNTGLAGRKNVTLHLPGSGPVLNAATKTPVGSGGQVRADFYPCELKAWRRP